MPKDIQVSPLKGPTDLGQLMIVPGRVEVNILVI